MNMQHNITNRDIFYGFAFVFECVCDFDCIPMYIQNNDTDTAGDDNGNGCLDSSVHQAFPSLNDKNRFLSYTFAKGIKICVILHRLR